MVIDLFYHVFDVYSMLSQLKHKRFFLFLVNSKPHLFPQNKHVVEHNQITTAIVTQT